MTSDAKWTQNVIFIAVVATFIGCMIVDYKVDKILAKMTAEETAWDQELTTLKSLEPRLSTWAKANNVIFPDVWAAACSETTDPELCIVMVQQESNGRTDLKLGKHGEVGPFQIIPKHWQWLTGYPSHSPKKAAQQWDLIMIELQERRSLPAAIGCYNGNGDGYVYEVWTKYQEVLKND